MTCAQYPLLIATRYNIPFLIDAPNHGNRIEGEIYEIDEKMLSQLDVLENCPEFYDRKEIDVTDRDGYSRS